MMGETEADALATDVLYETAKDFAGHKKYVKEYFESKDKKDKDESSKGPFALAKRIEIMLEKAPNPADPEAALTFGQMQLLCALLAMDEASPGCVATLGAKLEQFRLECSKRSRIAAYLKSGLRCPAVFGDLGLDGGYEYVKGPVKRCDFAVTPVW